MKIKSKYALDPTGIQQVRNVTSTGRMIRTTFHRVFKDKSEVILNIIDKDYSDYPERAKMHLALDWLLAAYEQCSLPKTMINMPPRWKDFYLEVSENGYLSLKEYLAYQAYLNNDDFEPGEGYLYVYAKSEQVKIWAVKYLEFHNNVYINTQDQGHIDYWLGPYEEDGQEWFSIPLKVTK